MLSNGAGYQCYALKLDDSAKLPISASKIENSVGVPISTSFTTGALNVAGGKLTVYPSTGKITANLPVTINGTLDVKPVTTSVLTKVSGNMYEDDEAARSLGIENHKYFI